MTRFEKLPLYLKWTGQASTPLLVDEYAQQFSLLVTQRVIDSDWVDGVLEYLQCNYNKQQFFLITATPQQEIEEIISQLQIADYFEQVIGSPTTKADAVQLLLNRYSLNPEQAVMIGDSCSDYKAATENSIAFVLRKTDLNNKLQKEIECQMIKDFSNG
jgi:phosphoglycolate phosphatase-like HAD superfamily hydrolase|tara:strand:- start:15526 stop:16002 length:477 start_codon:yes stop_codon:yes gene_type:complete